MHEVKELLQRRAQLMLQRQAYLDTLDREVAAIDGRLLSYNDADLPVPPPVVDNSDPKPGPGAKTIDYLAWAIRNNALEFSQAAVDVYGKDSRQNRQKLHKILYYMKKTRMVEYHRSKGWAIREYRRRGRPPAGQSG